MKIKILYIFQNYKKPTHFLSFCMMLSIWVQLNEEKLKLAKR